MCRLDNQSAEVDALISLGLAHMKAGNRQNAVRYLEDALDMFLQLSGDDASAHSAKVPRVIALLVQKCKY